MPNRHPLFSLSTAMKKKTSRSAHLPHCSMLAFILLTGCADRPTVPSPAPDPQLQQFAAKGYMSNDQFSLNTQPISWNAGKYSFDFLLSVPVRAERYPLVIYLPGLGESRSAGELWRNAWGQAGYAVLSIQLLADDAQIWQSREARSGDFKSLARQRHSAAAMEERLGALHALLDELRKRTNDAALKNVDLSRIVLAGYDIGAYTAMVAAGEKLANPKVPSRSEQFAAIIALSPFAEFSGPAFESRYAAITMPVLSITGRGDVDAYGWVTSETLRQAPFKHMPAGGKSLLMLEDCSHELLGGSPLIAQVSQIASSKRSPEADTPASRTDRGEGPGTRRVDISRTVVEQVAPSGAWAFARSAIGAVSTAYLDAHVKHDSFAQEWLGRDARRWLRETASLSVK